MNMTYPRIAAVLLCLALAAPAAAARKLPLPPEQHTPQAELWLARAFIGEAGWVQRRAHAGIAHILARRWHRMIRRWPDMRFETVIKSYAHALGFKRSGSPTKRQIWIRGLEGPLAPAGWPSRRSKWERHVSLWKSALDRSSKWFAGRLPDPCRGKGAWNWGGVIDRELAKSKRLRAVDCGDTGGTTFYDDGGSDE